METAPMVRSGSHLLPGGGGLLQAVQSNDVAFHILDDPDEAMLADGSADLQHGSASLDVCREILREPNNILIMFPEGTRSGSGALGRFRSGVARLAAGTSTPVVPCYLSGAHEAWPKGRAVPRPGLLRRHIGRPRMFLDVPATDREAVARAAAQLRDDVAALA